ncbi:hypothetical protein CA13_11290 [Planctomycetes bacterium CA13]|uniref:Uncharacterized protein n=1 Tax=Novipirellula herctigrandis TaxID=2527986 RepID=A0A5C5YXH1_9BACT|nr:hypothetical protein CA13_11290 [Planctomycetes bacterium CA13]
MTNPYKPTILTPEIVAPVDERTSACRFAVASVYGLLNICLLLVAFTSTPPVFVLILFLCAAAPATMWAYLDSDIRGYPIRLWEILVLATVWPIGLLVYLKRTRPKRGFQLWVIHFFSIIGVFVAIIVLVSAIILALFIASVFTLGISFPAQG